MSNASNKALVWLAEDLRLEDNLALDTAMQPPFTGFAVVRIQPEARGRPLRTPYRRALEEAAEQHLHRALTEAGIVFRVLGRGDDRSLARFCRDHGCTTVIRNAADGMPAEVAFRNDCERDLRAEGIPVLTVNGERIRRSGAGGDKPEEAFLSPAAMLEPEVVADDHPIALLRAFLKTLPDRDYMAGMWVPGRDRSSTSLLSTHFAAGTLSSDRAEAETTLAQIAWNKRNPGQSRTPQGKSFQAFRGRVSFRRGFLTVFSRYRDQGRPSSRSPARSATVRAWREGRTGIPMPDAAMRELGATGWINFRLRQMVTSYGVQLLGLPPHEVGDALAEMFDDYEPGITWMQVGLNDGTVMKERGPRILNPVKQGRDLDPDETYVREWIPELAELPEGFRHEPWLHPKSPLPPPLVDHKAAFREARANWGGKPTVLQPRLL